MTVILDSVAQLLDDSPLPHKRAEEIARRLCFHLGTTDWAEIAFLNPEGRSVSELARAEDAVRKRRDTKRDGESARERLFLATRPGTTMLDGYLLEFLLHWARMTGIQEGDIEAAVLKSLPEFGSETSH